MLSKRHSVHPGAGRVSFTFRYKEAERVASPSRQQSQRVDGLRHSEVEALLHHQIVDARLDIPRRESRNDLRQPSLEGLSAKKSTRLSGFCKDKSAKTKVQTEVVSASRPRI